MSLISQMTIADQSTVFNSVDPIVLNLAHIKQPFDNTSAQHNSFSFTWRVLVNSSTRLHP